MREYKMIQAWCRRLGSSEYYIAIQVDQARRDKAPEDAVYYSRAHDEWVRLCQCSQDTQDAIKGILSKW